MKITVCKRVVQVSSISINNNNNNNSSSINGGGSAIYMHFYPFWGVKARRFFVNINDNN